MDVSISTTLMYLSRILVFLICLPMHELAHAYVAYKLGDNTAKNAGRLTLNPIKSIDPLGMICMIGLGFGWAKPVPINPNNFKNPKSGMAISALAGPVCNLLLAFIGVILYRVFAMYAFNTDVLWPSYVMQFFYYFGVINIVLAVFNLIPIPPLDGSRFLMMFLPDKAYNFVARYERIGMLVLFGLLFFGYLNGFLQTMIDFVFKWMYIIVSFII